MLYEHQSRDGRAYANLQRKTLIVNILFWSLVCNFETIIITGMTKTSSRADSKMVKTIQRAD
jgi:hypothetical protein